MAISCYTLKYLLLSLDSKGNNSQLKAQRRELKSDLHVSRFFTNVQTTSDVQHYVALFIVYNCFCVAHDSQLLLGSKLNLNLSNKRNLLFPFHLKKLLSI